MNINFRVFRRNNKNLIFLWNSGSIPDSCGGSISVIREDDDGSALEFSRFVPENPEKFAEDVDGIVIPHAQNRIDPSKSCSVRVVFGEGEDSFSLSKTVKPANFSPESPSKPVAEVRMYGKNYSTGEWVPFPVDSKLLEELRFSEVREDAGM